MFRDRQSKSDLTRNSGEAKGLERHAGIETSPVRYLRHTYGTSRNHHRKNQFRLMLLGPTFTTGCQGAPSLARERWHNPGKVSSGFAS